MAQPDEDSDAVQTDMYFLARDPISSIKPYSMRYPPLHDLPQSNIKRDKRRIRITNLRSCVNLPSFDDCGFRVWNFPTNMIYDDFADPSKVASIYLREVAEGLKSQMGASIWKPIRGPLNDWPLALCDSSTVDFENDVMSGDIVYADWVTENMQVQYNELQTWYYLADHDPSEILLFKSADSALPSGACPHAGFYNPKVIDSTEPPRESIDCRAFVFYSNVDGAPLVPTEKLFQGHIE